MHSARPWWSLKSLTFQHPTENNILDHPKDVFHQICVRCCRREIIYVSVWVFVPLQILPLYILPEMEIFVKTVSGVI